MAGTLITEEVLALIGQETTPERNRFPISEEMAWDDKVLVMSWWE